MQRTSQEALRDAKIAISRRYAHNVINQNETDRQERIDKNHLPEEVRGAHAVPSKRTVERLDDEA